MEIRSSEVRLWVEYSLSFQKYMVHIKFQKEEYRVMLAFDTEADAELWIDTLIARFIATGFKQREVQPA